jgi:hypothetical protein
MPRCVLATVGADPHTLGLFRVARIARRAGWEALVLPPAGSEADLCAAVRRTDPELIGLSYRLSPEVGVREIARALSALGREGLLGGTRRIAVSGLPQTLRALERLGGDLPCAVATLPQDDDPVRGARRVLDLLGLRGEAAEAILEDLRAELSPSRIALLDELAAEVVAGDAYREEPPLPIPSPEARACWVRRVREAGRPLLRTHFGIPAESIGPTVEGIERIAEARVVDEISLGSSDLSQRFFGHPEEFAGRKNDGGVPYRTFEDLRELAAATRRGNFPSIKPYAHVRDLVPFVQTCLRAGMLVGAHQAVPLFWFNELDGRGPMTVPESIREHLAAVRELARHGIPVEMNDPNHWSSRWAHDVVFCADYGLIAAAMAACGVRDVLFQLQLNKPRETGDFADLAKTTAALEIARRVLPTGPQGPAVWRETRTGIDSLDPDPAIARRQLARSTLLQMILEPHMIHLVSWCEADHVAGVEDVVDSSRLVRRAVRIFRTREEELAGTVDHPVVRERREHLVAEATVLLRRIAALAGGPVAADAPLAALAPRLADERALALSLERGYLAAPGIFHPGYRAASSITTGPTRHGFLDCLDPETGLPLREEARLARLDAAAIAR